jgi:3-hydroxyacyl-CoA dehydrogenase
MTVSLEARDGIGLVVIDRPPVNAIDAAVRAGVLDAIGACSDDENVKIILIACRGRTFLSGADLAELGSEIGPPSYRETFAAIEESTKPVIASLHGTALGGGLELAMACDYRCAVKSARMGMPEITLGILPGAGGTQRLPRLIGAAPALELLINGAPIAASRAKELGLIDEIIGEDPIADGLAYARRLMAERAGKRLTKARPAGPLGESDIAAILDNAARALKGRTTQHDLVRLVKAAVETPFDAGLDLEASLSAASLESIESRALRHVFFAERECARIPDSGQARALPIARAAVIGAGTMGTGIAMALADAAIPSVLIERDAAALENGFKRIRDNYAVSLKRGRLTEADLEARMARISGAVDMSAAAEADVIIEAVFEDMDLKRKILGDLDRVARPGAILASNTSSLSITELAASTKRPEHVIGLHFFSPANVMRLLEIVRGRQTSLETIATGLALAKALKKVGVVAGDGFGFIGNRMMLDGYFREAELMLLEGVAPERIDEAMENFGFAMGPNRVNDMAGVDVGTKVRIELAKREPRTAPYHAVSDALTPLGRLGQKTGKGVYRYDAGGRAPQHDPEVDALLRRLALEHGISPRSVSDDEIVDRCVLSLVNIGAQILAERLAYRASDIDVVWTSGYGFPRWRGGPMFYADTLGLKQVLARIEAIRAVYGDAYWRPSPLLVELAMQGGTFADFDRTRSA